MGRDVTADKTPLLNNAEQNIGNSERLLPQDGTVTTIPQANPPRLLLLSGGSAVGQTTSVVLTASRIVGDDNPRPGFAGPITAVIEFGSGGRFTKVEVDVPLGPFAGSLVGAAKATEPSDGGTIITIPTSVLRVYLRYDNLLVQPILGPVPTLTLAQFLGVPEVTPGGPRGGVAEPILGKAMAAYFTRPHSKVYKTQYCYLGAAIPVSTVIGVLNPVPYCIPAFAKNLKVLRIPVTSALTVTLQDNLNILDTINIPSGTAPTIPIIGQESILTITSNTLADTVNLLALSYEIGI